MEAGGSGRFPFLTSWRLVPIVLYYVAVDSSEPPTTTTSIRFPVERSRSVPLLTIFVILLATALGILFANLNPQLVRMDYYFGVMEISLALAMALCLALGAVLGLVASGIKFFLGRREMAQLKKQLRSATDEIERLRTSGVKET